MDALKIIACGVFGHRDDVNGIARAVDHRCSSNSNFGRNLTATAVVTGGFPATECGGFPKRCGSCSADGIGVKGVNGTMFRGYIKNIFLLSADHYVGKVQRLRINFSVYCELAQLPEFGGVHVRG